MKPFESIEQTVARLSLEQLHDHIEIIDRKLQAETFKPMIRFARRYRQACLNRLNTIEQDNCPF